MTFTEGDLQIDFRGAVGGRRLDGPGHGLSHCMKAVDFVVKLPDHYLFVELKDDGQAWPREIVCACGVFNLESWNRRLPRYPVSRVGTAGRNAGVAP